jgi:hypothetical protein
MRAAPFLLALLLLSPGTLASAGDTTTAADATEPGRRLDRALDLVLDASARSAGGARTLCILVDPTPSLLAAGFPDRHEAALARNAERLATTEIAVWKAGEDAVGQAATLDQAAVGKAVRHPSSARRTRCATCTRTRAPRLRCSPDGRARGSRDRDARERRRGRPQTVTALRRAKVRTYASPQAYLADTTPRATSRAPRRRAPRSRATARSPRSRGAGCSR